MIEEMKAHMQERMKQLHQRAAGDKSPSDKAPEKKLGHMTWKPRNVLSKKKWKRSSKAELLISKPKAIPMVSKLSMNKRQRMMEEFKKRMQDRMQQALVQSHSNLNHFNSKVQNQVLLTQVKCHQ